MIVERVKERERDVNSYLFVFSRLVVVRRSFFLCLFELAQKKKINNKTKRTGTLSCLQEARVHEGHSRLLLSGS
jgi:hypothetical protein